MMVAERKYESVIVKKYCHECGNEMLLDESGLAHHINDDGDTDYDLDAEHTPYCL